MIDMQREPQSYEKPIFLLKRKFLILNWIEIKPIRIEIISTVLACTRLLWAQYKLFALFGFFVLVLNSSKTDFSGGECFKFSTFHLEIGSYEKSFF